MIELFCLLRFSFLGREFRINNLFMNFHLNVPGSRMGLFWSDTRIIVELACVNWNSLLRYQLCKPYMSIRESCSSILRYFPYMSLSVSTYGDPSPAYLFYSKTSIPCSERHITQITCCIRVLSVLIVFNHVYLTHAFHCRELNTGPVLRSYRILFFIFVRSGCNLTNGMFVSSHVCCCSKVRLQYCKSAWSCYYEGLGLP